MSPLSPPACHQPPADPSSPDRPDPSHSELLLEHAVDGIFRVTRDGRLAHANPALAALAGLERDPVGTWPQFPRESFAAPEALRHFEHELATHGIIRAYEYELRRRDGSTIWVSTSARSVRDAFGAPEGYVANLKDITARRHSQQLIREQAELINRAHSAIIVMDLMHRVTLWSQGAADTFGWSPAETLGRPTAEIFGDAAARLTEIIGLASTDGEWRGEVFLPTRQGGRLILDARCSTIRDGVGQPCGTLCIASDITAKKQFEERAYHSQRLEALGMLAAGIAHDLNNILTPILIAAPLLESEIATPNGRDLINVVRQSTLRGQELVRQILGFSRQSDQERTSLHLGQLTRELAHLATVTFPKSIHCEETCAPDLWQVTGISAHLHQVLLNICVNARDAMPAGGRLHISACNQLLPAAEAAAFPASRPGAYVRLDISDTGAGIPAESLQRIWQPFYTTKGPEHGTGLGLATVRGIVENHGGFVSVTSRVGEGSTFSVWLPASNDPDGAVPDGALPQVARGRGELVLVVDDEKSIRELVCSALANQGFRVLVAQDGAEAATLVTRGNDPALLVTDLEMPNLHGTALIQSLREVSPSLKVIAMTGSQTLGLAIGAVQGLLLKPFTIDDLLLMVQQVLRPPPPR